MTSSKHPWLKKHWPLSREQKERGLRAASSSPGDAKPLSLSARRLANDAGHDAAVKLLRSGRYGWPPRYNFENEEPGAWVGNVFDPNAPNYSLYADFKDKAMMNVLMGDRRVPRGLTEDNPDFWEWIEAIIEGVEDAAVKEIG
jgi:hypothetical protein